MSKSERNENQIKINSFDELLEHEREILDRIASAQNGGNLFMINPFMFLADIGIDLSEQAREEIIEGQP